MSEGTHPASKFLKMVLVAIGAVVFAFCVIIVGGLIYLFVAMSRESGSRDFADFTSSAVTRAIIQHQLGYAVYPMDQRGSEIKNVPADVLENRKIILSLRDSERFIGCDLPIEIIQRDVRFYYPTFSVMKNEWPRLNYVFFGFDIPDVQPYLDADPDSPLLAAAPIYPDKVVSFNNNGWPVNGRWLKDVKSRLDSRFGRAIKWRGVECDKFNYIEFSEW